MKYKIFIDGGHGTTGLKIHEYLDNRQDIEILEIAEEKRKDLSERVKMTEEADVSILCLPDAASKELAEAASTEVTLIDTSTAHRTNPAWTYGLPELAPGQREAIKNSHRIANPGCHATGFITLVRPLVDAGILPKDYPITSFCVTGYSGGGKNMIANHEQENRPDYLDSPGQYGISQMHKHLPEMKLMTGIQREPSFCPIVGDFYSGMVMTIPLIGDLLTKSISLDSLREIYQKHYEGEKLIQVQTQLPEDGFIHGNVMAGSNGLEIFVAGNEERPLVISRFDNLGKGASGAAVQNLNLVLGIEETEGLL